MIIDISDAGFKKIFNEEEFFLPIRWSGNDFANYLKNFLNQYQSKIKTITGEQVSDDGIVLINKICDLLIDSVNFYLNGFPAQAYQTFQYLMDYLIQNPLRVYLKSVHELFEGFNDELNLFRVVRVQDNIQYNRTRLFHTPYNLRSKVATCRYSIAGYPSLYLGTNLELCCEEIQYNPHTELGIASRFQLEREIRRNETTISVIELAVKPQDFFTQDNNERIGRRFRGLNLHSSQTRSAYLLWFPVIAACSFIRANKKDPFAAEYIVPQLLMQWVRSEMNSRIIEKPYSVLNQLIGVRYFSCASKRASDLGFNYVFPVSGRQHSEQYPFCPILMRAFRMTTPYFINEYDSIEKCERVMEYDTDLKPVDH